jgi:lipoate-protein ligase A
VDFDIATAAKVLKIPVEKVADKGIGAKTMPEMVKERMTTLNRELGREVAMEEAKEALKKGFEKALEVRLVEGKLTDEEKEMAKKFVAKYEDPEWIYKR